MHALPRLDVAVAHGLEGEATGDVDQHVDLAKVSCRRLDRCLCLCCVGQIDAADLDALRRRGDLRWRMVDAGHARAARLRGLGDDFSKCAQCSGHDQNLALHHRSPGAAV